MARSKDDEKYLKKRNGWYYYYRRVPTTLLPFYPSKFIRVALDTKSNEVAKVRRDELLEADEDYWAQLKLSLKLEKLGERMDTTHAQSRYEIAKAKALASGFKFRPMEQLADPTQIEEIVKRVLAVDDSQTSDGRLNRLAIFGMRADQQQPRSPGGHQHEGADQRARHLQAGPLRSGHRRR